MSAEAREKLTREIDDIQKKQKLDETNEPQLKAALKSFAESFDQAKK